MKKIIKITLLAFVFSIAAFAEEAGEEGGQDTAESKVDAAKMSNEQMTQKADTTLTKLRDIRKYVQNLLDQARKAKDIIKITCLNDKLTQINVNIRTYEDRMQALGNSMKTGDKAARNHEFNVLVVLEQKVVTLRMEAETCIGEAEGYLGKTEVTVSRPTGMAELDPTDMPPIGIDIFERPPPASPVD
ncbi:MAG: hypothetical protein ABIJ56_22510 [Pseudomonadota bacterium]